MNYQVHQIDGKKHKEFLAQERIDTVTQEMFRVGDKVVFCAGGCNLAFFEDSWVSFLKGEHCGQSNTLSTFPSPRSSRRFSNKKIRQDNISTDAPPTETPVVPLGTRVAEPIRTPIAPPVETPVVSLPISERPPVYAFSANTFSIRPGQSITLNWNVAASYVVSINQGIGSVPNTGIRTATPSVWFWGWLWLRNKRQVTYALTTEGPSDTFTDNLKIDLTLPALPDAISQIIQLAQYGVILSGSSPLRRLNAPLGLAAVLSNYKRLRTYFGLKQNQITLGDYVALITPPEIIRKLSTMPFYQRIPVGFFRRFKQWANTV